MSDGRVAVCCAERNTSAMLLAKRFPQLLQRTAGLSTEPKWALIGQVMKISPLEQEDLFCRLIDGEHLGLGIRHGLLVNDEVPCWLINR